MRDDFCVFILSHGRHDRVYTYSTLKRSGYTGKIYIVIDDQDKTADEYKKLYGDKVLVFSKEQVATYTDSGDNFAEKRAVVFARNACFDLARQVGCKYFIQLDDDYQAFNHNYTKDLQPHYLMLRKLDEVLSEMLKYYESIGASSIAMAQGGDFIGGVQSPVYMSRKCMNSFICSVDRPFLFFGKINEDVNVYVTNSRRGDLFFTVMQVKLVQKETQQNAGGLTDIYLSVGTYVKSFYSVMYAPSCVKISELADHQKGSTYRRIHHKINWNATAPKILRESHRKERKLV